MSIAPIYEIKALRDVVIRVEEPFHHVPRGESKVEITSSEFLTLKKGETQFVYSVLGVRDGGDELGVQFWPPEAMPTDLLDSIRVVGQKFRN